MKRQSQILIFFLTLTLTALAGGFVYAAESGPAAADSANQTASINLDKATAAKGYTVKAFDGQLKIILAAGVLRDATAVDMIKLNEAADFPWQLDKLSVVYQLEIKNKAALNSAKPFYVQLAHDKASNYYKQVYYFDKNFSAWRPLPTVDYPAAGYVRAALSLPFARLAVFANQEALVMGQASWYKYKGGLFAASPDFPKNSRLRVINTANGKSVDVTVHDFGPDRRLHPSRVIDLDKVAFKKLAPAGAGVINVRVEPLKIVPENGQILGIGPAGAKAEFGISAKAAVALDESSGEILWQKNATSSLPLASLTKLVAVKVFLDTKPSLNQPVVYRLADEEYNYQYADKAEVARLKLNDGDVLTVENLLYAALVGSANNAVESLVRVSGLTRPDFIDLMNRTAADWGAKSTNFVEPTGLAPANVSSALDYAIITKQVYLNPIIQKASTMSQYKFATANNGKKHTINNTDRLLATSDFKITGSKTGYLDEAGYCLVARGADLSGRSVIAVTLGVGDREKSFAETEELLRYGHKLIEL